MVVDGRVLVGAVDGLRVAEGDEDMDGTSALRMAHASYIRTRSHYLDFYPLLALEAHFSIANGDEVADAAGYIDMRMCLQHGYDIDRFMECYAEEKGFEVEGAVSACDDVPYFSCRRSGLVWDVVGWRLDEVIHELTGRDLEESDFDVYGGR